MKRNCCIYHAHCTFIVHSNHYSMTWWIHTYLLPVRSCSSSLRMDFPSMSGGVSRPAMWRMVGARSMFSTMWGFLKINICVQIQLVNSCSIQINKQNQPLKPNNIWKIWNLKLFETIHLLLTLLQVPHLVLLRRMALWYQNHKAWICLWLAQTDRCGSHDQLYRWCMCCPAHRFPPACYKPVLKIDNNNQI